jgi:CBS domain-containing protein
MPTVDDILRQKGSSVATIDRDRTVLEAAQEMNHRRIGSLVVTDGSKVVGMFTERDILTRIVAARRDPERTKVGEVMTAPVLSCQRETELRECKQLVTSRRIRHIPILENGELVGLITSGDILARESHEREEAIEHLNEYIHGPATHVA